MYLERFGVTLSDYLCCCYKDRGATLKVVGLTSDSKWYTVHFFSFSVTPYNFQKSGIVLQHITDTCARFLMNVGTEARKCVKIVHIRKCGVIA